jgi:ASC-1-like (ASCH) protein
MNPSLHHMRLNQNPFEGILSGSQKIEARLKDEKRKELKVGDEIEFSLRENLERKFRARIKNLLYFDTFEELYNSRPASEFNGRDLDHLLTSIFKYYSKEDEARYGVVGIELEILKEISQNS